MEKKILASYNGTKAKVGELEVNRLLPNRYIHAVGPFVFLDHIFPFQQRPKNPTVNDGRSAHPHRGIATFSYLFSGELEHFDSAGNHDVVKAGGAQWMKAGNGIIHDEGMSPEFQRSGGVLHGIQFWINLPSKNKEEDPAYLALQPEDVPEVDLGAVGKLRVLIGAFQNRVSPVESYSEQFIYHIRLNGNTSYVLSTKRGLEYAAFVPAKVITVNNSLVQDSEILAFADDNKAIHIVNTSNFEKDIIVFGGEPYEEPIVAEGPFVMNTRSEIADAYSAFFNGSYGKISYKPGR
jgi:redox-sensitive bicupin YhaK (pirin superfamily)